LETEHHHASVIAALLYLAVTGADAIVHSMGTTCKVTSFAVTGRRSYMQVNKLLEDDASGWATIQLTMIRL
jgi:hypothetical protein